MAQAAQAARAHVVGQAALSMVGRLGAPAAAGGRLAAGGGSLAAVRRPRARRPQQLRVQAGLGGGGGGRGFGNGAGVNIPNLVSAVLTALGIPHTIQGVRKFLGGGGGGGAFDQVKRLIDYYFSGEFSFLPLPCVPCTAACSKGGKRIDPNRVVAAMENLVRGMDAVCRYTQKKSLLEYLYGYLTVLINSKLTSKQVPVLKMTGIRPIFGLGQLIQYDITRGVRIKILDWVFREYVDYYIEPVRKFLPWKGNRPYNLNRVNAELFSRFRPQVIAFLTGRDGDLAPVVGFLTRHLLEFNQADLRYPSVPCALCSNAAFSCEAKLGKAQTAVAKAVIKRVPRVKLRGVVPRPGARVKVVRNPAQRAARQLVTGRR